MACRCLHFACDLLPVVRAHALVPVHPPRAAALKLDAAGIGIHAEDQILCAGRSDNEGLQAEPQRFLLTVEVNRRLRRCEDFLAVIVDR